MPEMENEIAKRLDALDLTLFDKAPSQSSIGDRQAWLAVQRSVRKPSGYTYLEIGSHLGGSLQQHLLDPWCRSIVSIDKRPLTQPDDRGELFHYEGNSTARMLEILRPIAPDQMDKIVCFDSDASEIDPAKIPTPPDYCFIDGEHTYAAVLSDFEFCLKVASPDAAITFHDDSITHRAIRAIVKQLKDKGIPFTARKLTGGTFALFLRNCPCMNDPFIRNQCKDPTGWFRFQWFRQRCPNWLRPAAKSVVGLFKR